MTEKPGRSAEGIRKAEEREARLAEALRANLRRRKGQKKARAEGADDLHPDAPEGDASGALDEALPESGEKGQD